LSKKYSKIYNKKIHIFVCVRIRTRARARARAHTHTHTHTNISVQYQLQNTTLSNKISGEYHLKLKTDGYYLILF